MFADRARRLAPYAKARTGLDLASPKSSIFAWPRRVTKMFAGLMSRCTMPPACAASSASAISIARSSSGSISREPCDAVLQRRPSSNSITMNDCSSCSPIS